MTEERRNEGGEEREKGREGGSEVREQERRREE